MRLKVLAAGGLVTAWCGLAAVAAAPRGAAKPAAKPAGKTARTAKPAAAKPAGTRPAAKPAPAAPAISPEEAEFFEKEIRPVLAQECYSCHGPKVAQAGLRLDSRAALLHGGDKGPSLVPGAPNKSLLIQAIRHEGLKMPPGRRLPEKQVAALEKWVQMGAPWPGAAAQPAHAPKSWDEAVAVRKQWWSLQPVRKPVLPKVKNAAWSTHPVDRFILSSLEKKGLKPAPRADRRTLIRRLYLTLTGLPPTAEEVEQFVKDPSPNAYPRLVDRILASPHYGERWARHWMDVVRYGETHGYEWNYELRDAWRYRDYLIRAFNNDVPYNQLVREHIAGDLLPQPRMNAKEGFNESVIGTAFYRFGENGHDVFKEIGLDVLDNQIDTLSKAFQATTISCARCHDHKLDAVSTKDYYALLGMLASSRQVVHTLDTPDLDAQRKQRLRELKGEIRKALAAKWSVDAGEMDRYLVAAQAVREKKPEAETLKQGLDAARLQTLVTALEKRKPGLDEPLAAWLAVTEAQAKNAPAGEAWSRTAEQYAQEAKTRAEFNAKHFIPFGDFRQGAPAGWRVDGLGLHGGPAPSGDFAVADEGEKALLGIFPAGLYTHTLSQKLNGSIQSPFLPGETRQVSFRVLGNRSGVVRQIPDQRQLTDAGTEVKSDDLKWVTIGRSDRDDWVYVELITKEHNPRWAPGDEKGKPKQEDPRSYFGVTQVVLHNGTGEAPKGSLGHIVRLFQGGEAPKDASEAAARYEAATRAAIDAWAAGKAADEDAEWLDWAMSSGLLSNSVKSSPEVEKLIAEYRSVEKGITPPRMVSGVADVAAGFDVPIFIRGDFRTPGELAPRRYLEVLSSSERPGTANGSGRWELAQQIATARNPLTARVMVNRVWHYLFGRGLVRTPDDFGHMGEKPTHPALLDYLAARFTEPAKNGWGGWSVKSLVRQLVLSETFQMSGQANAALREKDPDNLLLHHFPARRMEAEVIRDSILTVSGRLDRTLYGPSIQPHRVDPKPERRLWSGPLDGEGRRSIYTKITLMGGPAFLEVFNFPDPKTAMGRRDVTNVPAQALTLLNDPFVLGQADVWAERLVSGSETTVAERIQGMFQRALARPARPQELARVTTVVKELASLYEVPAAEVLKSRPVWKDVAHALFNLKEFIYVR